MVNPTYDNHLATLSEKLCGTRNASMQQMTARIDAMEQLLSALEDMARQHCCTTPGTYETDSGALSTNAHALKLLAEHKRFTVLRSFGRMVVGYWPEDAEHFNVPDAHRPIER